jgi:endonuclease/exonuclease/phosphatase family metal-dependent hydrolase
VAFDPYAPYGPLVASTFRVVTWNVRGRHGSDWRRRQSGIEDVLAEVGPDVVCLVEAWQDRMASQPELIAKRLGLGHHRFEGGWEVEDWTSGLGVVSRWPMTEATRRPLRDEGGGGFGEVLHVVLDAEHGPIQLFVAVLDYPLGASALRQSQVKQLAGFVSEVARRRFPTVICGDFNAGPDSDEIGMLTGRSATAVPDLVFYDAWEVAGDGTPGYTWSNANPLAALGLYPNRRFDYIFSAWPRQGGVGHPTQCALLGMRAPEDLQLSDHYGVVADLRY